MLQKFTELVKSKVTYLIVGIIAFMLAFTGIESLIPNNKNQVAKVGSQVITHSELKQEIESLLSTSIKNSGGNFNLENINSAAIQNQALEALIEKKLLLSISDEYGMDITSNEIDNSIMKIPAFQENNNFNKEKLSKILRSSGITIEKLRALQYEEAIISQLFEGLCSSEFITDFELNYFQDLEFQNRSFSWILKEASSLKDDTNITEDMIKDYFNAHKSEFKSENEVSIEYVILNKNHFLNEISTTLTELQSAYKDYVKSWKQGAKKNFKVSAIILDTNKKGGELKTKGIAEEIISKLNQGDDFSELAKKYSDDARTAYKGGELGTVANISKQNLDIKAIVNNLWINEYSKAELINSKFYIVKLHSDQKIDIPQIDDVKNSLEKQIKSHQADDLYVKALREIAEISAESPDLTEAAEYFNLKIESSLPFALNDSNNSNPIVANNAVRTAAFSNDIIELKSNSDVIEISDDSAVIIRLKQFFPSRDLELSEVKNSIKDLLTTKKIEAGMHILAKEIITELKSGHPLKEIAIKNNMAFKDNPNMPRKKAHSIPYEISHTAFVMPKPKDNISEFSYIVLNNGDLAVIELKDVSTKKQTTNLLENFRPILASMKAQQMFKEYIKYLRSKSKISIQVANDLATS